MQRNQCSSGNGRIENNVTKRIRHARQVNFSSLLHRSPLVISLSIAAPTNNNQQHQSKPRFRKTVNCGSYRTPYGVVPGTGTLYLHSVLPPLAWRIALVIVRRPFRRAPRVFGVHCFHRSTCGHKKCFNTFTFFFCRQWKFIFSDKTSCSVTHA